MYLQRNNRTVRLHINDGKAYIQSEIEGTQEISSTEAMTLLNQRADLIKQETLASLEQTNAPVWMESILGRALSTLRIINQLTNQLLTAERTKKVEFKTAEPAQKKRGRPRKVTA